ncbi:MAG: 4Fe-4S dicluster domain-containing protein [Chloroflexi bacterium]|nr:4Fe-4S dicluster domain-containing protein [Chloroflexota bacterium]
MTRLGMVIDLAACNGCNTCTLTCKVKNGTPPGIFWRRVLEQEVGSFPSVRRIFLPLSCMHCANPPCETVCPTGATHQRPDGIVTVDYDICIGCQACMVACPYGVRFLREDHRTYYKTTRDSPMPWPLLGTPIPHGVVSKCDFCLDRVTDGQKPACVQNCPTGALSFGDLEDPRSEVAQLIATRKGRQLLPEKGTNPSIFYVG